MLTDKAARPNEHNQATAGEIQRSAKLSLLPRATTHKAVKFTLDHSPHHPLSCGSIARFSIGSLISYTSFANARDKPYMLVFLKYVFYDLGATFVVYR